MVAKTEILEQKASTDSTELAECPELSRTGARGAKGKGRNTLDFATSAFFA
jgi:hypothetical protein